MNEAKKKRLEAAGWKFGSIQDFLGLDDSQMESIELHTQLVFAIRKRREKAGLTLEQVAERTGIQLSKVKAIDGDAGTATFDQMFSCYFALGGRFADLQTKKRSAAKARSK